MGQKQTLHETTLEDILFTEEEIIKNVKEREQIFEIKEKGSLPLGFVNAIDFKTHLFSLGDEGASFEVRQIDSKIWTGVFEHAVFQRRRPQLVSAATLSAEDDQEFFILKHGQKTGPYAKNEIVTMLEEKEVLLTDMISSNGGHTWSKLYQVENFDRRALKESDQLPGVPTKVISHSNESVITITPVTEAISSLAYLSNVKRGKTIERDRVETYQAETATKGKSSSLYKWLLVGSIIGIGYFLFHIKNQLDSPFSEGTPAIGEQAQMLTPVETTPSQNRVGERRNNNQINDQRRNSGKFESRSMRPIQPTQRKSFMETGRYQEIQAQHNTPSEEDQNYYYDNASAMELDPVRSQVSKENFDETANPQPDPIEPIPSSDAVFESEVSN